MREAQNVLPQSEANELATSAVNVEALRQQVMDHLSQLGLPASKKSGDEALSKQAIREMHAHQRRQNYLRERRAFGHRWSDLLNHFADGVQIDPTAITPQLEIVDSKKESGLIFRLASLIWSVPVSKGYGRRMRYLIRDQQNGKLIGIFALGDPVFNLRARDQWIGWDVEARRERLVNVMDAYVVGAVPPYSQILGGKLVVSLIGSRDISEDFREKYSQRTGIISGKRKAPQLSLVTVTSALGRSSLYNRVRLRAPSDRGIRILVELVRIGKTQGYGHFQLPDELFQQMRSLLESEGHPYASGHEYGQGPNWRLRVMRVGLRRLGLDDGLVRHGIVREVYAMPLASNFREYLNGAHEEPQLNRPSAGEIASAALERWILPRAKRRSDYRDFRKEVILGLITPAGLSDPSDLGNAPSTQATQQKLPGIPS